MSPFDACGVRECALCSPNTQCRAILQIREWRAHALANPPPNYERSQLSVGRQNVFDPNAKIEKPSGSWFMQPRTNVFAAPIAKRDPEAPRTSRPMANVFDRAAVINEEIKKL